MTDYLVSWVVGELPHSLAARCSLHASGLLCQALRHFIEEGGSKRESKKERARGGTAFVSDLTIKTSNRLQHSDRFPSMPVYWQIKEICNFRVMLFDLAVVVL